MNITVYCGSSFGVNKIYKEEAVKLGKWIAYNNHTLVYGGGNIGLMGAVADSVLENNGNVIGVIPTFLVEREVAHKGLKDLEVVSTMAERKTKLLQLGNIYIALPGGPGTLEEISEVISLVRVKQNNNPYLFYNVNNYYESLEKMFDKMVEEEFLTFEDRKQIVFINNLKELEVFIEGLN